MMTGVVAIGILGWISGYVLNRIHELQNDDACILVPPLLYFFIGKPKGNSLEKTSLSVFNIELQLQGLLIILFSASSWFIIWFQPTLWRFEALFALLSLLAAIILGNIIGKVLFRKHGCVSKTGDKGNSE